MEDGSVAFPLGEVSTRASGRGVVFVREGWRVCEGGGECVLSWGLNSSLALSESFTNYLLDDEQNYHLQVEALWLIRGHELPSISKNFGFFAD